MVCGCPLAEWANCLLKSRCRARFASCLKGRGRKTKCWFCGRCLIGNQDCAPTALLLEEQAFLQKRCSPRAWAVVTSARLISLVRGAQTNAVKNDMSCSCFGKTANTKALSPPL